MHDDEGQFSFCFVFVVLRVSYSMGGCDHCDTAHDATAHLVEVIL